MRYKLKATNQTLYFEYFFPPNRKANELHRLYDSKSTFPINDVAKVVFSIECASMILDVQFDSGAAQKESTLTAKQYAHNMQNFRKALNLTKHVQVGDLCIHLELADNVKQVALKLLDEYRKQLRNENDIKEAHYVAMAVHQACKHWKVKGARIKSHLKQESRLESKQWGKLEETWAKWIEKEQPLLQKSKVLKDIDETG